MARVKNYFDEPVAARYDDGEGAQYDPEMIELLAELADDGAALEFAIGTGRVALPLAARGVRVHGIELSEPMAARLRAKTVEISVTLGDMATTRVDEDFRLVYLVFNTIMNLTTQDAQIACFENAARHLEPGGRFVIEVGVPDLRRLPPGERLVAFSEIGIDEYDVATQGLISHHWRDGRTLSIPFRYVWPAELDLMARIAGMSLCDRWEDWDRSPFTSESRKHVSVWTKAG
jgi:SAM-dependent methyltransferase